MDGIIGINLGSGPWSFPGWVGVDARHLEVSEHLDEHSRLLFPDNSLSYVFSSHFFEHINDATAQNMMNESARVLRPGGILRITVPDYELVLDRYHHGDHDFFDRGDWNMTPRYENWRGCGIEPTPETKLVYAFANYATESAPPDLWPPWHYIPGYYNGPPKIDDNEVRDAAASIRFSSAVCSRNSCGIWNERAMPLRVMRRGAMPTMGRPSNRTLPLVGFR